MARSNTGWRGAARALAGAGCVGAALVLAPGAVAGTVPVPSEVLKTTIPNLSGFGMPLRSVVGAVARGSTDDLQTFATGQLNFIEVDSLPELGPLFNGRSCASCHFQPAVGGSGAFINEVRVRDNPAPGPVHIFASDNILRAGAQKQGALTVFPQGLESTPLGCQITSPSCVWSACQAEEARRTTFSTSLPLCDPTSAAFAAGDNCSAERQAPALFGLGLVEAVADGMLQLIAAHEPPAIRGTVRLVSELGATRVARYGWKDDIATLRGFAGDAYLNEIGITNPDHPAERSTCALDQLQFGVLMDAGDDPEDATGADGRADIDRFTDFMRALAPPPILQRDADARAGHRLFQQLGCNGCHVETMTTAPNPAAFLPPTTGGVPISASLNRFLANRMFHPFSDFLLHDMGSLGDGITSGVAGPTMMRTAPLWGVRAKSRLLHDGRASSIGEAVRFHDGQAAAARDAFQALSPDQQQQIAHFLDTI